MGCLLYVAVALLIALLIVLLILFLGRTLPGQTLPRQTTLLSQVYGVSAAAEFRELWRMSERFENLV